MDIREFHKEMKAIKCVADVKLAEESLDSDAKHYYAFNCAPLDIGFGGGVASGKIYEVMGYESHGKSTLAEEICKNFDRYWKSQGNDNYLILWLECESAFDKVRAAWMGFPLDRTIFSEVETLEEAELVMHQFLQKAKEQNAALMIVYDTIAASPTENEKNPKLNKDGSFNAWCLTGDTQVKCMDGQTRTMLEMKELFESGMSLSVYSLDSKGDIRPGRVTNAFQSGVVTELVRVELDDGTQITCTPNHRFMTRKGSYVEAQHLTPGRSLMPLYTADTWDGYERIRSPRRGTTHHLILKGQIPSGYQVHHRDFNKRNNHPDNLQLLTKGEHCSLHLKEYNSRESTRSATAQRNSDPEFREHLKTTYTPERKSAIGEWTSQAHEDGRMKTSADPEFCEKVQKTKILQRARKALDQGLPPTPESYLSQVKRVRDYTISSVLKWFGTWDNLFEQAKVYNHKVKSITRLRVEPTPVYDLTVEDYHNFAVETSPGSCVFVHNSGGMSEKPRVIRSMLRKITPDLGKTNSTLILVNQVNQVFGRYQSSIESPGGGGIKFHASVRTLLTKTGAVAGPIQPDGSNKEAGIVVNLKHVKNKLTLPRQETEVIILNESGLDPDHTTLNYLASNKIINLSGSWKTIESPKSLPLKGEPSDFEPVRFQTVNQFKEKLEFHPHLRDWLSYQVYLHSTTISPLLKVKIIQKVWDYEEKFFGKRRTTLTDKERDVARMIMVQERGDLVEENEVWAKEKERLETSGEEKEFIMDPPIGMDLPSKAPAPKPAPKALAPKATPKPGAPKSASKAPAPKPTDLTKGLGNKIADLSKKVDS